MKNTREIKMRVGSLNFSLWIGTLATFIGLLLYHGTGREHARNSQRGSDAPMFETAASAAAAAAAAGATATMTAEIGYFKHEVLAKIRSMNNLAVGRDSNGKKNQLALVGIFCKATHIAHRNLIRKTILQLAPSEIKVKFVICQRQQHPRQSTTATSRTTITAPTPASSFPSSPSSTVDPLLWSEMQDHDDLFLMDCDENMNNGKSYQFFREAAVHCPNFNFYGKADIDAYILFHNLAILLASLTKEQQILVGKAYFATDEAVQFNHGALYLMSRDLVSLLEDCTSSACRDVTGSEDAMMGKLMLKLAGPEKVKYADIGTRGAIIQKLGNTTRLVFEPFSVYVHPVKNVQDWWSIHQVLTKKLSLKALEESFSTNFIDGQLTSV
jgi:hypothetical protein